MDVRDFEYLVALADTGSVTKAAAQLCLTQPAVSKFIQEKEKEHETLLFNRVGKQLIPTYTGNKCIEAARKILQINAQLDDDIMLYNNNDKGRIRLGFQDTWTKFFFAKIYPEFRKYYPDIELYINEGHSDESIDKINNGILDIAIISSVWEQPTYYTTNTICIQDMMLGVHKDDPIITKAQSLPDYPYPFLDIQNLNNTSFIMRHPNSKTKRLVHELFRFHGIKPKVVLETNSRAGTLNAINEGIGVSFLADDATQLFMYENVRYLSVSNAHIHKNYLQIIHNKGVRLNPVEEELLDLIISEYTKITSSYSQQNVITPISP